MAFAWYLISVSYPVLAGGTVTNCDQASLEAALTGGGNVTFACSGVIALTNTISIVTNTVLDGTGQSVTISGNDAVRIFNVTSNVSFTLINLTLTHGNDVGVPGNDQTPGGSGKGGAVFVDGGVLNATDCQFDTNQASGGTGADGLDAGDAYGGAIYSRAGSLNLTNCVFVSNQTVGGGVHPILGSGQGGDGSGGAIYNEGGNLYSMATRYFANTAQGGVPDTFGGADGAAFGGAVYSTNGTLEFQTCILSTNKTVVGPVPRDSGAAPAGGGAIYANGGSVRLVSSVLSWNECSGDRGWRATEGKGGAIFNGANLSVTNCTFSDNHAIGGASASGSTAGDGGAIYSLSNSTIGGTTFSGNSAIGGQGAGSFTEGISSGADGKGGGVYSVGAFTLVNCTLLQNTALGGDGANTAGLPTSDGGPGRGGAVYVDSSSATVTNLTFVENTAKGGRGGIQRSDGSSMGGAVYVSPGAAAIVVNTILADSPSGSNSFGVLTDAGHNISSDDSCGFSSAGSLNNTDPKLGPLGDYGGPTETIPLLSGSPAIDAGDAGACPATDQRGISRPYGAGCDIGAFESVPLYTVNGHIRGYLSPAGVTVNIGSNSILADPTGFYTFTGLLPPGTYVVIPTAPETRIVPSSRMLTVGPDSPDTDFKAYRLNALAVETLTNSDLHVVYAGDIDATYRTLVSTNLTDWSLYSTNRTDTNGVFVITNLYNSSDGFKFLQVVKP